MVLRAVLSWWLAVAWLVAGCGGGGGSDSPDYALLIDAPAASTTSAGAIVLTGEGFLPPGSTCSGGCEGLLPPPVFGDLGPYTLTWRNDATGETGPLSLSWICNCGGNAPYWSGTVPLAPGDNLITVTMSAGEFVQSASVTITRE
jgi:hypothetical protein